MYIKKGILGRVQFPKENRFVKNVTSILSVKIFLYIASTVTSIYLTRILGAEGKGELAIVTSVYGVVLQFGCLGIHSAHTYYISKDRRVVKKCEGDNIVLTGLILLLVFFLLPFFGTHSTILNLNGFLLVIALLLGPLNLFIMLQENLFIAIGCVKQHNVIEVLNNVLYFCPLFLLSFFIKITVETVSVCILVSTIIIVVYSIKKYAEKISKEVEFSRNFLWKILQYGIKSYCANLLCYLILRVDVFMLNYFCNDYEVGVYSLAVSLIDLTFMVSSSICLVLFPHLGTLHRLSEKLKALKRVYMVILPIMGIGYMLMVLLTPYVIPVLYGEQFLEASDVLKILIPGAFCWSAANYLFQFFSSENSFTAEIVIPMISLIINVLLNCNLIPYYGNRGAAFASTVAYCFCFGGMLLCVWNYKKRRAIVERKQDNFYD